MEGLNNFLKVSDLESGPAMPEAVEVMEALLLRLERLVGSGKRKIVSCNKRDCLPGCL